MLPIWRAFLPLLAFTTAGAILDRVLSLGLGEGGGPGRLVRWAACGLVACFAAALHPAVLAAFIVLALIGRLARDGAAPRSSSEVAGPVRGHGAWWIVAAAALTLVVVCRPPALDYWDSFVWLAKSRIESTGWGALKAASLDPTADVVPSGYPLLWPLAASWLSMGGRTVGDLAAGAAAATLLALYLFLDGAADVFGAEGADSDRPRWAPLALGLVVVTPLVFVHLRSSYADLPVGLLAATCTLRLARSFERPLPGDIAVAALCAAALAGTKDEGMAHVAALGVAAVAVKVRTRSLPLAPGLAVLAAAAIPFNGWRLLLSAHHVTDLDHKPSAPDFHAASAIGHTLIQHLADTRSWGALWPLALACAALVLVKGCAFGPLTRFATFAFLAEGLMLAAALFFGPDRVRAFAFEGTLVNRLLLQLTPPAGVMLMLALADAAAARKTLRRDAEAVSLPASQRPVPVLTRSSD
jgi:hypothetical protein